MIYRIQGTIQLVGLHALNNPKTDGRGNMKLATGDDLWFDVNPNNFQLDDEGVNVYASFGQWAN